MDPLTGLACGRIGLGAVSLLSPTLACRLFLLDPTGSPQLGYVTRLFGAREVALGALTLTATGPARRALVQAGVAVDASDAVTGLVGALSGEVSKPAGILLTAVAAAAVATGVQELTAG